VGTRGRGTRPNKDSRSPVRHQRPPKSSVPRARLSRPTETVAVSSDREPRQLSVAGTVQALAALAEVLDTVGGYESFARGPGVSGRRLEQRAARMVAELIGASPPGE
jgi:hypothetical protein